MITQYTRAVPTGLIQLLEACCNASPVDVDSESRLHLVNSSFAAVSGRGKVSAMSFVCF